LSAADDHTALRVVRTALPDLASRPRGVVAVRLGYFTG
jgi:hypothetical protein